MPAVAAVDIAARLTERRMEIEQTILARVHAVEDPGVVRDPVYVTGLRAAVSAAVAYGIDALRSGSSDLNPVPSELLEQAHNAVRGGVALETVLRRYVAGHGVLSEFIVQEAGADPGRLGGDLRRILRIESAVLDRLIAAVAAEYRAEAESRSRSLHQRRFEQVKRLLAGELVDASKLDYDLAAWHLAVIVIGVDSREVIRDIARGLDRSLLLVQPDERTSWVWLGADREFSPADTDRLMASDWPNAAHLAVGEPGQGVAGWRLSHRQATSALPIALHGPAPRVRYAEVALLASILQDDVLTASLDGLYLAPLAAERDGGRTLRNTLRAYFAAERNVSSAAAALGVSRQTVIRRIHTVERHLGRPLGTCAVEVETALSLQALGDSVPLKPASQHVTSRPSARVK